MRITCEVQKITPLIARRLLDSAGPNRTVRQERVLLYAEQIKRGDWFVTNQGVGIDENDKLIDGQHRLLAVIQTGVTTEMVVVRGLKEGTQLVLDQPVIRQLHDQIKLDKGFDVSVLSIAVARQMLANVSESDKTRLLRRDPLLVERFYMRYREGIEYACHAALTARSVLPGIITSPIVAAIARAYYHTENHELLNEFTLILANGLADKQASSSAIALRNYLIRSYQKRGSRAFKSRREMYCYTEIALTAFLARKPMTQLPRKIELVELFPLRAEKAMKKAA